MYLYGNIISMNILSKINIKAEIWRWLMNISFFFFYKTILLGLSVKTEIKEGFPHILIHILDSVQSWNGLKSCVQTDWSRRDELETFLPGKQIYSGNSDGITRYQRVSKILRFKTLFVKNHLNPHNGDCFLKLRGCMYLMLSPLSQWTRARLDFLISTSWCGLNFPGFESPWS